jgi:hypothetical protein
LHQWIFCQTNFLHESILRNQFFAPMSLLPNQFFTRINSSQSVLCTNESSAQSILYTNESSAPINSSQSVLCTNESSVKPILCTNQLSWFDRSNFETDKYQFTSPILFVIPLVTTVLICEKFDKRIHHRSNMLTFWSSHWIIDQSDMSLKVLPSNIHHDVPDGFCSTYERWVLVSVS